MDEGAGYRERLVGAAAAAATAGALIVPWVGAEAKGGGHGHDHGDSGKLLFFASDGLRQDAVEKYADDGDTPGFRELLRKGTKASDNGLLTQAPPNTGAGWFTLATGAWPGVHGSTNNTFHINGAAVRQLDVGARRPERAAGRDARAGRRARRQEGRPDRVGGRPRRRDQRARRSTSATSAPAAAWPRTTSRPRTPRAFTRAFGAAVRPPRRLRQQRARSRRPRRRPRPAGPNVPRSYSPAKEMRLRVDRRRHATSTASTPTSTTAATTAGRATTACCSARTKSGADAVGDLARASGPTSRSRSPDPTPRPTRSTARPARSWSRSSAWTATSRTSASSTPRHARDRDLANWPGEPGFTGTFEDFVAERFASSQAGDFAVLEAGIVSEETYIEQGEYWEESYHPLIKYVLDKYKPDLAMVGYPVTDEVQHQFLGLVTQASCPTAPTTRPTTTSTSTAQRDDRVKQRERFIREAYEGSDETMRLAQDRMRDHDLTTFVVLRPRLRAAVPGHRREQGARRPRAAVAPADRPTAARRTRGADAPAPRRSARPRPATPAARCRST